MHLALYREERPETFEDIIGQKHIVRILQNQLAKGRINQAYLFTGIRGTGKTSTARILAKAVNCTGDAAPCGKCENCRSIADGSFFDVIELDAASNNKVEDIRSIIDSVQYAPTAGRYKVYIIDEVHMLTDAAENAFLKTLEEPPEHVIFILATTDPEKVKDTIKSRCMPLNFRRVSESDLVDGMTRICEKHGREADREALALISAKSDGSVRDALGILEQCMEATDGRITAELVAEQIGSAGDGFYLELTDAAMRGDISRALLLIDESLKEGRESRGLLSDWLMHFRNLMVVKYVSDAERAVNASPENIARMREQTAGIEMKDIERAIRMLSEYVNLARYSATPRLLLETALIRISDGSGNESQKAAPVKVNTKDVFAEKNGSAAGGNAVVREEPVKTVPAEPVKKPAAGPVKEAAAEPIKKATAEPVQAAEPVPEATAEPGGDPLIDKDKLWDAVCSEMSGKDMSFMMLIGRHCEARSYSNDELVIAVAKRSLKRARDNTPEMNAIVRKLATPETFITFIEGEVTPKEIEPERIKRDVPAKAEQSGKGGEAEAAAELFGIPITITDE